ncbi:hypothetical protein DIPPA_19370 [Diplonema papillatum]|nr:hypothetical protein DIPPA_19370 [Diplonema papillatum]
MVAGAAAAAKRLRSRRGSPLAPFRKRLMRPCAQVPDLAPGGGQGSPPAGVPGWAVVWCAEVTQLITGSAELIEDGAACGFAVLPPEEPLCDLTKDLGAVRVWQVLDEDWRRRWEFGCEISAQRVADRHASVEALREYDWVAGGPKVDLRVFVHFRLREADALAPTAVGVWVPCYWSQAWGYTLHGFPRGEQKAHSIPRGESVALPIRAYTSPAAAASNSDVPASATGAFAPSLLFCWLALSELPAANDRYFARAPAAAPALLDDASDDNDSPLPTAASLAANWVDATGSKLLVKHPSRDLLPQYVILLSRCEQNDGGPAAEDDVTEAAMGEATRWAAASTWMVEKDVECLRHRQPAEYFARLEHVEADLRASICESFPDAARAAAVPMMVRGLFLRESSGREDVVRMEHAAHFWLLSLEVTHHNVLAVFGAVAAEERTQRDRIASLWGMVRMTDWVPRCHLLSTRVLRMLKADTALAAADCRTEQLSSLRATTAAIVRVLATLPARAFLVSKDAEDLATSLMDAVEFVASDSGGWAAETDGLVLVADCLQSFNMCVPAPAKTGHFVTNNAERPPPARHVGKVAHWYRILATVLTQLAPAARVAFAEAAGSLAALNEGQLVGCADGGGSDGDDGASVSASPNERSLFSLPNWDALIDIDGLDGDEGFSARKLRSSRLSSGGVVVAVRPSEAKKRLIELLIHSALRAACCINAAHTADCAKLSEATTAILFLCNDNVAILTQGCTFLAQLSSSHPALIDNADVQRITFDTSRRLAFSTTTGKHLSALYVAVIGVLCNMASGPSFVKQLLERNLVFFFVETALKSYPTHGIIVQRCIALLSSLSMGLRLRIKMAKSPVTKLLLQIANDPDSTARRSEKLQGKVLDLVGSLQETGLLR